MAHLYLVESDQRLIAGGSVRLSGDEARHAAKAARLRESEEVLLGDGRGTIARAQATRVESDRVDLVVVHAELSEAHAPPLWLVQSLAKSGRDEQAIEQATEVGVARIFPLQAARSVVRWSADKADKAQARWQKIVTEATKQSLQAFIPEIAPVCTIAGFVRDHTGVQIIALDHRAESSLLDIAVDDPLGPRPIALLVGPEGGWSDDERDVLERGGATWARLGSGVLRTSSAGPIGLALLHARLRHW